MRNAALACSKHLPIDEGKTILPRYTKLDKSGQHSLAKSLGSQSKQQPGHLQQPLAEFDSPCLTIYSGNKSSYGSFLILCF